MKLTIVPGDLLILRWPTLPNGEATSSYFIVAIDEKHLASPQYYEESAFWYMKMGDPQLNVCSFSTIERAVDKGDLEVIDIVKDVRKVAR